MSLLDELSPYLRGVLTRHCYGPAIASVPFFNLAVDAKSSPDVEIEMNLFVMHVRSGCGWATPLVLSLLCDFGVATSWFNPPSSTALCCCYVRRLRPACTPWRSAPMR